MWRKNIPLHPVILDLIEELYGNPPRYLKTFN